MLCSVVVRGASQGGLNGSRTADVMPAPRVRDSALAGKRPAPMHLSMLATRGSGTPSTRWRECPVNHTLRPCSGVGCLTPPARPRVRVGLGAGTLSSGAAPGPKVRRRPTRSPSAASRASRPRPSARGRGRPWRAWPRACRGPRPPPRRPRRSGATLPPRPRSSRRRHHAGSSAPAGSAPPAGPVRRPRGTARHRASGRAPHRGPGTA